MKSKEDVLYRLKLITELLNLDLDREYKDDEIKILSKLPSYNVENCLLYYYKYLRGMILPLYNNTNYEHGILHIDDVVWFATLIAGNEQVPEEYYIPIILSAAFHDCGRVNDCYDELHGKASVDKLNSIIQLYGEKCFKYEEYDIRYIWADKDYTKYFEHIMDAIRVHTTRMPKDDNNIVAKVLCDADRIRLSWEYGYDERFYSTETGKKIAQDEQLKKLWHKIIR